MLKDPETMPTPHKLVLEYAKITCETYEVELTEKRAVRFNVTDIFGNKSERIEHRMTTRLSLVEAFNSDGTQNHQGGKAYLSRLKSEIPPEDVQRATAAAGSHFLAMGGEIIPLNEPQTHYLNKFSPVVHEEYLTTSKEKIYSKPHT